MSISLLDHFRLAGPARASFRARLYAKSSSPCASFHSDQGSIILVSLPQRGRVRRAAAAERKAGGHRDAPDRRPRDCAGGRALAGAGGGCARRRMAEPSGQDRRCLRARRQRRSVWSPDGGRACGRVQAAILRGEPAGQQRRDRIGAGRARRAGRIHLADRRIGPAPHRSGDQSQYRLRPAQGFHPHRDDRRRQLRLGRQPGAGRDVDRRTGHARQVSPAEPHARPDHLLLARAGLARPSPDRAVQAQGRHRHPARAGAEFRGDRRARQPYLA